MAEEIADCVSRKTIDMMGIITGRGFPEGTTEISLSGKLVRFCIENNEFKSARSLSFRKYDNVLRLLAKLIITLEAEERNKLLIQAKAIFRREGMTFPEL